jgi:hypothetical protein
VSFFLPMLAILIISLLCRAYVTCFKRAFFFFNFYIRCIFDLYIFTVKYEYIHYILVFFYFFLKKNKIIIIIYLKKIINFFNGAREYHIFRIM